jgi:hypothetical protein
LAARPDGDEDLGERYHIRSLAGAGRGAGGIFGSLDLARHAVPVRVSNCFVERRDPVG